MLIEHQRQKKSVLKAFQSFSSSCPEPCFNICIRTTFESSKVSGPLVRPFGLAERGRALSMELFPQKVSYRKLQKTLCTHKQLLSWPLFIIHPDTLSRQPVCHYAHSPCIRPLGNLQLPVSQCDCSISGVCLRFMHCVIASSSCPVDSIMILYFLSLGVLVWVPVQHQPFGGIVAAKSRFIIIGVRRRAPTCAGAHSARLNYPAPLKPLFAFNKIM